MDPDRRGGGALVTGRSGDSNNTLLFAIPDGVEGALLLGPDD